MEATGTLWEPLHDMLTRAGYVVLVLNLRQTSAWAASLGLRAKTDGIDAQTLARGLLAGYARASTLPSETIQALRALTRARRDLIGSRSAAGPGVHDELVLLFPELMTHLPKGAESLDTRRPQATGAPTARQSNSHGRNRAQWQRDSREHSAGHWGVAEAEALQARAPHSTASTRAVAARSLVVRTLARPLLDLARAAERTGAGLGSALG
jgi:transposase